MDKSSPNLQDKKRGKFAIKNRFQPKARYSFGYMQRAGPIDAVVIRRRMLCSNAISNCSRV